LTCRKEVHPLESTSPEALRRHRAVHADAPESRRVWLFQFRAHFDHDVPERIAEARALMDLVVRTLAGTDTSRSMASPHSLQGHTGAAASKCCSRVKRSPTTSRG